MAETKYPKTPIRILLGGGIGSGKTIAGGCFEALGAMIVEADRLGREVLEHNTEAFELVSDRWPSVVADNDIDRSALAEIVFANREQLSELEALTHPLIIRRITELASTARDVVIEIPVILDVPGEWMNVFVDTNEDSRLARAVQRGNSEMDVRRRMDSQPSRHQWMTWSDVTIDNSSSIDELKRQIDTLWYEMRDTDYGPWPES